MSVLYEVGIIDKCTVGWGTIYVSTPEKTTFLYPENPVEAVTKLTKEEKTDGEERDSHGGQAASK